LIQFELSAREYLRLLDSAALDPQPTPSSSPRPIQDNELPMFPSSPEEEIEALFFQFLDTEKCGELNEEQFRTLLRLYRRYKLGFFN